MIRVQQIQPVNFNQVINLVKKLSEKEKDKLFIILRNERLRNLLAKLRKSTKGLSLTFDEITDEVETVRKARYETKSRK